MAGSVVCRGVVVLMLVVVIADVVGTLVVSYFFLFLFKYTWNVTYGKKRNEHP